MKHRIWLLLAGMLVALFAFSQIRSLVLKSFYAWHETPSAEEIAGYKNYLADEEALRRDGGEGKTLKEIIRSLCEKTGEKEINGWLFISYTSDRLKDYIPQCLSFKEIYDYGELLVVSYTAVDGRHVNLAFDEEACRWQNVYSETLDLLYENYPDSPYGEDTLWHHYRKGNP